MISVALSSLHKGLSVRSKSRQHLFLSNLRLIPSPPPPPHSHSSFSFSQEDAWWFLLELFLPELIKLIVKIILPKNFQTGEIWAAVLVLGPGLISILFPSMTTQLARFCGLKPALLFLLFFFLLGRVSVVGFCCRGTRRSLHSMPAKINGGKTKIKRNLTLGRGKKQAFSPMRMMRFWLL